MKMFVRLSFLSFLIAVHCVVGSAQTSASGLHGANVYGPIKAFELSGGSAVVSGLALKRDRVNMTFTGTFYFAAPVEGRVTGAVFIGNGTLRADVPPSDFEKANVRRLLKADVVTSDFSTAVLRFTDDAASVIAQNLKQEPAPQQAVKLAAESNSKVLRETGANIAARLALSLLNGETPGFFFASFDGGKLGNFSYVLDHQNRIPTTAFVINGGEKGLIYTYKGSTVGTEVLMAFYSESDYARSSATYSDAHDIVDVENYDLQVDLRSPKSRLALRSKMTMRPFADGVRAISFSIGESLGEYEDARLKKQMRVKAARSGGSAVPFIQEDWEGGFTVVLPEGAEKGVPFDLEVDAEGDFLREAESVVNCSYPRSNEAWYPRHGYLDRATYTINYLHAKKLKVASVGLRETEAPWAEDKDVTMTRYRMNQPIALATFALGPWERHAQTVKFETSDKSIPLEFNSVSGASMVIKESFILAELNNSVRFFNALFGAYPYDSYSATFHPYGFGQGFPSMLMIPPADRTSKYTFAFISHETAHQWWGNIVAWRSYRDQWLSEGFAEYSGALYTSLRDGKGSGRELLEEMRDSLKRPPRTLTGLASGKLNDVGPIVLGHRLSTTKTIGAYQTLIYNKGALVLRMIHFLLSDPATGDDKPFYAMMRDFTSRYGNKSASTDDFRAVAGEHFARSPIGRKYQLQNLDWFFRQWVFNTAMPSYKVDYQMADGPDGSVQVTGSVTQENVPEDWFMPIPVQFDFGGNQIASGTVHAYGPSTPFQMKLPRKPNKLEVDPNKWLIAEKISVK
jgi:predicted aconitase with swiveling domain